MEASTQNFCKNLDQPDEKRSLSSHGYLQVVHLGQTTTIGRGVFEPGWKWSNDVKPSIKTESCEVDHNGYCISGTMHIRMNNGEEFVIHAGDAFHIPPGHDAWVEGNENCVMIDMGGFKNHVVEQNSDNQAA